MLLVFSLHYELFSIHDIQAALSVAARLIKQPRSLAEGEEKSLIALFVVILVLLENGVKVVVGAKLRKNEGRTKETRFFFLPIARN